MFWISKKVCLVKKNYVALPISVNTKRKEEFVSAAWSASMTWQEWEAMLLILFIQCSSQWHHCLCSRRHKAPCSKQNFQRNNLMPTQVLWRVLQSGFLAKCYHWPLSRCTCSDQDLTSPAVNLCCCLEPVSINMWMSTEIRDIPLSPPNLACMHCGKYPSFASAREWWREMKASVYFFTN